MSFILRGLRTRRGPHSVEITGRERQAQRTGPGGAPPGGRGDGTLGTTPAFRLRQQNQRGSVGKLWEQPSRPGTGVISQRGPSERRTAPSSKQEQSGDRWHCPGWKRPDSKAPRGRCPEGTPQGRTAGPGSGAGSGGQDELHSGRRNVPERVATRAAPLSRPTENHRTSSLKRVDFRAWKWHRNTELPKGPTG